MPISTLTLPPPPDCPKMVTTPGSPPNAAMLSRTHSRAATMSSMPTFAEPAYLSPWRGQIQIAQDIEPMIQRDHHNVAAPGQVLAVIGKQLLPGTGRIAAAMQPYHHRAFLAVANTRRPNIHTQTILALNAVIPREHESFLVVRPASARGLRRDVSKLARAADARPWLGRRRRQKAVRAFSRVAVRNPFESEDLVAHIARNLAGGRGDDRVFIRRQNSAAAQAFVFATAWPPFSCAAAIAGIADAAATPPKIPAAPFSSVLRTQNSRSRPSATSISILFSLPWVSLPARLNGVGYAQRPSNPGASQRPNCRFLGAHPARRERERKEQLPAGRAGNGARMDEGVLPNHLLRSLRIECDKTRDQGFRGRGLCVANRLLERDGA